MVDLVSGQARILQSFINNQQRLAFSELTSRQRLSTDTATRVVEQVHGITRAQMVVAYQWDYESFELCPCEGNINIYQVAIVISEQTGYCEIGTVSRTQPLFDTLRGFLQLDHEPAFMARVKPIVLLNAFKCVVDNRLVKIVASQPHVALQVQWRKDASGKHQHRNIKGSTAKVVDQQRARTAVR